MRKIMYAVLFFVLWTFGNAYAENVRIGFNAPCPIFTNCCKGLRVNNGDVTCDETCTDEEECTPAGCCPEGAEVYKNSLGNYECCEGTVYRDTNGNNRCCPNVDPETGTVSSDKTRNTESASGLTTGNSCCYGTLYDGAKQCCKSYMVIDNEAPSVCVVRYFHCPYDEATNSCYKIGGIGSRKLYYELKNGTYDSGRSCSIYKADYSGGSACWGEWKITPEDTKVCVQKGYDYKEYTERFSECPEDEPVFEWTTYKVCGSDCKQAEKVVEVVSNSADNPCDGSEPTLCTGSQKGAVCSDKGSCSYDRIDDDEGCKMRFWGTGPCE